MKTTKFYNLWYINGRKEIVARHLPYPAAVVRRNQISLGNMFDKKFYFIINENIPNEKIVLGKYYAT